MHICIVSPDYPTEKTINFVFVDQLCRALAEKGQNISIIAPQSLTKSVFRNIPIASRHSILRTKDGIIINLYRPFYFTFGNSKIFQKNNIDNFNKSVLKTLFQLPIRPDVCYGHFWNSAYSIYPYAKKYGIPLFVSSGEEEINFHKTHTANSINGLTNYLSGVISVSSKNKKEIVKAGLTEEQDCEVIPNAINSKLFFKKDKNALRQQMGFSEKDFLVAFVGQFTERKGVLRLSNALKVLNDDSIKALFIGSGVQSPDYKHTLYKGTVNHDLLPNLLNCADIFVLPTLNEGCSNSIIEAMACGIPVISSDLPFNHDILTNNNSIMIDPYDINAIAGAIKLLKNDKDLRSILSANAFKTGSSLSIDKRAEKIINYVRSRAKQ